MIGVKTAHGAGKAGVSRYALTTLETMARMRPDDRFAVFVKGDFERPQEWSDLGNVEVHEIWKVRPFEATGGWWPGFGHFDAWFSPAYTVLAPARAPQVAMIHDLFPLTHPEWFPEDMVDQMAQGIRRACRRAARLLANSEATRQSLVTLLGIPKDRVDVTPLGPGNPVSPIAPGDVDDLRLRSLGIPVSPYLFTLSTLEPRKNLPRLLEAFERLAPTHPELGLVIGGAKGWRIDTFMEQVRVSGLADRVTMLGYVPDEALSSIFARCTAYVCPSVDEGFGMPLLEAMAAGAITVSSDAGALREVGGDAARYFDPVDVGDMVRALDEAVTADDRVVRRAAGFKQASRFTWEAAAKVALAALERVT